MTSAEADTLADQMRLWRRDLHARPGFGFEEKRTAAFVAAKLREFGLDDVAEGVGGTGVVGTLKRGSGNRAIALRADMDALRIAEQGEHPHGARFHAAIARRRLGPARFFASAEISRRAP